MATTWHDRPGDLVLQSRYYLLTDGSIVKAPAFEETGSGLKTRVKGRPETSIYTRDFDDLLRDCLKKIAADRGARLWMPVDVNDRALESAARLAPATLTSDATPATLEVLGEGFRTKAWWLFRHPTMPAVSALLVVELIGSRVDIEIFTQDQVGTDARTQHDIISSPKFAGRETGFRRTRYAHVHNEDGPQISLATSRPSEVCEVLSNKISGYRLRPTAKHFFEVCQRVDGMSEIQIPDMRPVGEDLQNEAEWMTLEFVNTNCTPQLFTQLQEYLNDETGVVGVAEAYDHFRAALVKAGMVLPPIKEDQFAKILQTGQGLTFGLTQPLATIDDAGHQVEDEHHLAHINVTTGAVVVTCNRNADETAYAWEESKLRAELTGEVDALLAYARKHVQTDHDARVKRINEHFKK